MVRGKRTSVEAARNITPRIVYTRLRAIAISSSRFIDHCAISLFSLDGPVLGDSRINYSTEGRLAKIGDVKYLVLGRKL